MTTRVTIDPSGHKIEVTLKEGETETKQVLEVNTPATDFWIYGVKTIAIREIPPGEGA